MEASNGQLTSWQEGRQLGAQLPVPARRLQQGYPPIMQERLPQQPIGAGGGLADASFIGGVGAAQPPRQQLVQQPQQPPKQQRKQKQKTDKKAEIQHKLAQAWTEQWEEMQATTDFRRGHILPLARIKKIMKIDEDVRMISAEAPIIFGKACELFIIELTMRAWQQTEQAKRRTLQRTDVRSVVMDVDVMDFLMDVVPAEEPKSAKKEEGNGQEGKEEAAGQQQSHATTATAQQAPQDLGTQVPGAGGLLPADISYGISSSIDSRGTAAESSGRSII